MGNQRLQPSSFTLFQGEITLEKSKSIANRILLLQALSSFSFTIDDVGNSDDVLLMKKALASKDQEINVAMAGTALRFLCAGFSLLAGRKILDGLPRLKERPIAPLLEALKSIGAKISFSGEHNKLPIIIEGGFIDGSEVQIEQGSSSQFISALMMIGPFLSKGLRIKRKGKRLSDSYIQLTKHVMEEVGLLVEISENDIHLPRMNTSIEKYTVEGDWSAAAYWMAFVVLAPEAKIKLKGMKENSAQGDKEMLIILKNFGLNYQWEGEDLILFQDKEISLPQQFTYDCSEIPDQAQTLAFLCAALEIETKLTGLETLYLKETNRVRALKNELEKLGLAVEISDGSLSFKGTIGVETIKIATYNDHRMAMAGALLGCRLVVEIEQAEVVSKSYPSFWTDLKLITNASASE